LSVAMLKVMPDASQAEPPGAEARPLEAPEADAERQRARLPG
jgi:hypothetical protein